MAHQIKTASTYLSHLKILTEDDMKNFQVKKIEELVSLGQTELSIYSSDVIKIARVDFGRWLIDCECGSGLIVDPDWENAYCTACGAIYPGVVFPAEREQIEKVLEERPYQKNQFWFPERGETLEVLQIENVVNLRKT